MTSRALEPGKTRQTEGMPLIVETQRVRLPGPPESPPPGRSDPSQVFTAGQLRAHADELGFSPQDQVRWLAPVQLARTAVQVLLATAFSSFNDKRELQRSFPADPLQLTADPDGG